MENLTAISSVFVVVLVRAVLFTDCPDHCIASDPLIPVEPKSALPNIPLIENPPSLVMSEVTLSPDVIEFSNFMEVSRAVESKS